MIHRIQLMTPMTVNAHHLIVMWLMVMMMMVMMGIMIVSRNVMVMGQIMGIVAALMGRQVAIVVELMAKFMRIFSHMKHIFTSSTASLADFFLIGIHKVTSWDMLLFRGIMILKQAFTYFFNNLANNGHSSLILLMMVSERQMQVEHSVIEIHDRHQGITVDLVIILLRGNRYGSRTINNGVVYVRYPSLEASSLFLLLVYSSSELRSVRFTLLKLVQSASHR